MLDKVLFLTAIKELEESNNIPRDVTQAALKEAFEAIYKKKPIEFTTKKGVEVKLEENRVEVNVDIDRCEIDVSIVKKVVASDDDINDDALEISLEEAKELDPNAEVGGDVKIPQPLEDFTKADALKFKSMLKQKVKEAEKAAIYATYTDKIGELITGVVEKTDPFTIVNIGKTSVPLIDSQKIGDEKFQVGQPIKVYLSEVNSSTSGPQIRISRADPGFLKRLFEEEIPEIYDGTVKIMGVARKAGERSKVSVTSTDENVDPIGACIGTGGSKIQKICTDLGKEKIDIVQYHEYPGLFIAEALKPAEVLGVKLDEETRSAVAVVKNDDLRVAIGKKGINAVLAVDLTKWKIDIKEVDVAMSEGIAYESLEAMKARDEAIKSENKNKEMLAKRAVRVEEQAKIAVEEPVDLDETEEEVENVEASVESPVEEAKASEEAPAKEEKKEAPVEEAPVEEEPKVEYKPVRMQPKVSLDELEKQIEEEKKKPQQPSRKKFVKKDDEEEKKETTSVKANPDNYMPIYTEDEEEEFEEDEDEATSKYDDDSYEEYDDDSFYEDK